MIKQCLGIIKDLIVTKVNVISIRDSPPVKATNGDRLVMFRYSPD